MHMLTHSVVFPNIEAVMIGFSSGEVSGSAPTIPQIAPAARVKIIREIRLIPATSTIDGNMTISLAPT